MQQDTEKPGGAVHTPGPWVIDPLFPTDVQTSNGGTEIATMVQRERRFAANHPNAADFPVTFANARLIAAAPELLEAPQTLRRICSDIPAIELNPKFAEASRAALAAIAKATGGAA